MEAESVLNIGREAMILVLLLSGPPVLAALTVALLVAILQAATQLQEQTLSLGPKMLAVFLALAFFGSWILGQLATFTVALFETIPL